MTRSPTERLQAWLAGGSYRDTAISPGTEGRAADVAHRFTPRGGRWGVTLTDEHGAKFDALGATWDGAILLALECVRTGKRSAEE